MLGWLPSPMAGVKKDNVYCYDMSLALHYPWLGATDAVATGSIKDDINCLRPLASCAYMLLSRLSLCGRVGRLWER